MVGSGAVAPAVLPAGRAQGVAYLGWVTLVEGVVSGQVVLPAMLDALRSDD